MSFPPPPGSGSRGVSDTVRTRRYVRHCRRAALADEEIAISFAKEGSEIPCGRVRPGDTLSLPRTCCLADSNISLRVRPLVKETEYSFSHAATSSSENRGLVLGQMQDGTHLQVCAPGERARLRDRLEDQHPSPTFSREQTQRRFRFHHLGTPKGAWGPRRRAKAGREGKCR